jgi:hypothetical protein
VLPRLTRQNGDPPVEARQVSTNFSNCTTVIETGVPSLIGGGTGLDGASGAGTSQASGDAGGSPARQTQATHAGARTTATDTHSFRVTWYDIVGITVNWVQSNITATVSGSCVTSASGTWEDYWLTLTGWGQWSASSSINPSNCASRTVSTNVTMANGGFCYPGTVWVYYNGVSVFRSPYATSGWVNSTYEQNAALCPSLHYGESLS